VIENNKYAMGTSVQRSAAGTRLCDRGIAYGIPGEQVDGMDVAAVRQAGAQALAQARKGNGPTILEMMTYRYRGHSMSDPAKYRTKEEVAKMRQEHDPIDRLRERLLAGKMIDEAGLKNLDREVKDQVSHATEFAQSSPEPDPAELYTDVLVEA